MCGIAGIINIRKAPISISQLQAMGDALRHRGGDAQDNWLNEACDAGFSHRRLAIIDLSAAGRQPMHYKNRYTLVFNGFIYNYIELREQLKKGGCQFQSATDTEVILAAYDLYGEECVDHFEGMFAFAIWDEHDKKLFAARDRFGEKPFYYFYDEERIVFASEMKALWAVDVPKVLNQKMAFNYLTIGYLDNPNDVDETFFEGINKLPAAHVLLYDARKNELVLEKYWDLDPSFINKNINEDEAIERFHELLKNSVSKRFRSDVAVGTSLSGGLDSSALVAATASINPASNSYTCFTAAFPDYEKNELPWAQMVAAQFNLKQFTVAPSADVLLNDLEKIIWHQEVPVASASVLVQYKVYELAAREGIKVLLDGQGADETLAGYHKYYKWYWQELFRKRKLIGSKEISKAQKLGVKESFGLRNIIAALAPEFAGVVLDQQYLVKALTHPHLTQQFIRQQSKEAYYSRPATSSLNGALYFNTCMHGLEELLHYADRNSMAHGREVRLPFLDHQLVEFIFSLPPGYKIKDGWTKWIMRKAMEKKLPGDIVWRKDKVGYEPPQKTWMQEAGVRDAIVKSKNKLVHAGILKKEILQKNIVPRHAHEAANYDWRYWMLATLAY